jgi:hypothetical protein
LWPCSSRPEVGMPVSELIRKLGISEQIKGSRAMSA